MPELPEVRPNQVWADNDPRAKGRLVRIVSVHAAEPNGPSNRQEPYARVAVERVGRNVRRKEVGEQRTIKLRRFRPTRNGYRLVQDAPAAQAPYPEAQQSTGDAWNWGGTDVTPDRPDADA
jgi:hypothetical protein